MTTYLEEKQSEIVQEQSHDRRNIIWIRECKGPSLAVIQGGSRNDCNPNALCMNREIQAGLSIARCTLERQHGTVPKNFTKFVELTKRTRNRFLRSNLGSGALSRSGIDAEERDNLLWIHAPFMHMMSKVDLALEEQENHHGFEETHNSYYG